MFRFTIRDVLWLTVVVGLAVAYIVQHRELGMEARARYDVKKLVTLLHEQGYRVMWDDELDTAGAMATDPPLPQATQPKRRPDRTDIPDYWQPFSD